MCVFKEGSIAYAHYGGGAGLSVRSLLEMNEEPLDHFQQLAAQR